MKKNHPHLFSGILVVLGFLFPALSTAQVVREFKVNKKYLNIPIEHEKPQEELDPIHFVVENDTILYVRTGIAAGPETYWIFKDVSTYKGKTLKMLFSKEHPGLDRIHLSNTFPGQDSLFHETFRPQYHFSSRRGWNNDPNGMVWYKGRYHLFYQHNPYSSNGGNTHWGHATSKDMIHWKETNDALCPDEFGYMYSGSAVVDKDNTAGFGKNTIVAIYTGAANSGFTQCIAYSEDNGKTLTKYAGNPVIEGFKIKNDLAARDPKVFWYEPIQQWVMVVYGAGGFSFYNSPDLKNWKYQSDVNGFYECPDMFELSVDGNPDNKKWVVTDASGAYLIGTFDGYRFTPEPGRYFQHNGVGYAAQTFSNEPRGKVIQMAWHRAEFHKGMPFNQQMTLPVELSLRTTNEGVRLCGEPVPEVKSLHGKSFSLKNVSAEEVNEKLQTLDNEYLHVVAEVELKNEKALQINFKGKCIVNYQGSAATMNEFHYVPEEKSGKKFTMELFIDKISMDAFFDEGKLRLLTNLEQPLDPAAAAKSLEFSHPENIRFNSFAAYEMKSIWK